jgi:hypothetical protein
MNDRERTDWCDNDEGLYLAMRASGLSKSAFVRANRAMIDATIAAVTSNQQPAHYRAYPRRGLRDLMDE